MYQHGVVLEGQLVRVEVVVLPVTEFEQFEELVERFVVVALAQLVAFVYPVMRSMLVLLVTWSTAGAGAAGGVGGAGAAGAAGGVQPGGAKPKPPLSLHARCAEPGGPLKRAVRLASVVTSGVCAGKPAGGVACCMAC